MSDNLRVRLEFKGFPNPELKNTMLLFRKSETKDVQRLEVLIQKKYRLKQPFGLFIDSFALERTEPIDILRDNDIIIIEPKVDSSIPSVSATSSATKTVRPKPRIGPKSKMKRLEDRLADGMPIKHLTPTKRPEVAKTSPQSPIKTYSKVKLEVGVESTPTTKHSVNKSNHTLLRVKTEKGSVDTNPVIIKQEVTEDEMKTISSTRDVPMRRAFKEAAVKNKLTPQPMYQMVAPKATTSHSEGPKLKRKRPTKEATEKVDRWSPIIVLNRFMPEPDVRLFDGQSTSTLINSNNNKKQSARKTFPNSHTKAKASDVSDDIVMNNRQNIDKELEILRKKKEEEEKKKKMRTIFYEELPPMTALPNVGDLLAFRMLTLASDGIRMEASPFNTASVVNVDKDTQMVDVLLKDTLHRTHFKHAVYGREEQPSHIISLKINWSTVLEPKLIESAPPLV